MNQAYTCEREWLEILECVVVIKISTELHFEREGSCILECVVVIKISTELHFLRDHRHHTCQLGDISCKVWLTQDSEPLFLIVVVGLVFWQQEDNIWIQIFCVVFRAKGSSSAKCKMVKNNKKLDNSKLGSTQ